jgi:hypothetical protein
MFAVVFRSLLLRKTTSFALGLETGVSVPNDVSCSGDASLRSRLRCPDDMNYKGCLEFMREFLPLFILQRQESDISVDRVFSHRYLGFTSVAITNRAKVAQRSFIGKNVLIVFEVSHIHSAIGNRGLHKIFLRGENLLPISAVSSPIHRIRVVLFRYVIKQFH